MEGVRLEGRETGDIDRALERVTEEMKTAIDSHAPNKTSRLIPHPEIDLETKNLVRDVHKLKILLSLYINYAENRRKLYELRELIREG